MASLGKAPAKILCCTLNADHRPSLSLGPNGFQLENRATKPSASGKSRLRQCAPPAGIVPPGVLPGSESSSLDAAHCFGAVVKAGDTDYFAVDHVLDTIFGKVGASRILCHGNSPSKLVHCLTRQSSVLGGCASQFCPKDVRTSRNQTLRFISHAKAGWRRREPGQQLTKCVAICLAAKL